MISVVALTSLLGMQNNFTKNNVCSLSLNSKLDLYLFLLWILNKIPWDIIRCIASYFKYYENKWEKSSESYKIRYLSLKGSSIKTAQVISKI